MTATAPTSDARRDVLPLLDLIERQVAVCLELERQSSVLLEQLSKGEFNGAADLIAARTPLVDELTWLSEQFQHRCPSWSAYLSTLSPSLRDRGVTLAARLADLLNRVRTMDDLLSERLAGAKTEISQTLAEMQSRRRSSRAYVTGTSAGPAPGRNRFMDKRG